jgi:hypothetical protein
LLLRGGADGIRDDGEGVRGLDAPRDGVVEPLDDELELAPPFELACDDRLGGAILPLGSVETSIARLFLPTSRDT